jgi:hypothetical protein
MADLGSLAERLVIAWVIWVAALAGLVAWTGPVSPVIILGGLSSLWMAYFLLKLRHSVFRDYVKDWFFLMPVTRFLLLLLPQQPPAPAAYNPNPANTIITLLIATIIVPVLYGITWHPELNQRSITLERDTVVCPVIQPLLSTPLT